MASLAGSAVHLVIHGTDSGAAAIAFEPILIVQVDPIQTGHCSQDGDLLVDEGMILSDHAVMQAGFDDCDHSTSALAYDILHVLGCDKIEEPCHQTEKDQRNTQQDQHDPAIQR